MAFDLDPAYKQVPERIADFKAKHPEGCLRPLNPDRPFWLELVEDRTFVCYAAAAYRTPDDPTPGVGVAWEPYPGRTPYTRDSELQNAETSAWGRAIVAALASESKSVASAEDVRNRRADEEEHEAPRRGGVPDCVLCGLTLAGSAVHRTKDGPAHAGACPVEARKEATGTGDTPPKAQPAVSPVLPLPVKV